VSHDRISDLPRPRLTRRAQVDAGCKELLKACVAMCLFSEAALAAGLYHHAGDWELACDITLTCRAAGYQRLDPRDEAEGCPWGYFCPPRKVRALSVLLTRRAGPSEALTARVRLGDAAEDPTRTAHQVTPFEASLSIDGRYVGTLSFRDATQTAELTTEQVSALVRALLRGGRIEWVAGQAVWRLSSRGAGAALGRMDVVQGRSGTLGAIVHRGPRSEESVKRPKAVPIIVAQPLPDALPRDAGFAEANRSGLLKALHRADRRLACPLMREAQSRKDLELQIRRLSADRLLISTLCEFSARVTYSGFWVVRDSPPFQAVAITLEADELDGSTIRASRTPWGRADCVSREEWTWNGKAFVRSLATSTGLCRSVALDGVWDLPTLITETRGP